MTNRTNGPQILPSHISGEISGAGLLAISLYFHYSCRTLAVVCGSDIAEGHFWHKYKKKKKRKVNNLKQRLNCPSLILLLSSDIRGHLKDKSSVEVVPRLVSREALLSKPSYEMTNMTALMEDDGFSVKASGSCLTGEYR